MRMFRRISAVLAVVSCFCFAFCANAEVSAEADSVKAHELGELEVKASRVVHKVDHDVLYLSGRDRKFGTNALDAISSSKNFKTSIDGSALSSFDGQSVYILINGIASTPAELRTYQGSEIKCVEYYPQTPAQYLTVTDGPVANVIIKRKKRQFYSAYANTCNAVNMGDGTNMLNLTYADSLNQVKVDYQISNICFNTNDARTQYHYGDGWSNSYEQLTGKRVRVYQYVQGSYQRYQGKHLFNARVNYSWQPYDNHSTESVLMEKDGLVGRGVGRSALRTYAQTVAVDLYYHYQIDRKRKIAFNVVNTLSKSNSANTQDRVVDDAFADWNYSARNRVDNKTYSLIANGEFTTSFGKSKFAAGMRYEYMRLLQESGREEYEPQSNKEFLYSSLAWKVRKVNCSLTVGLSLNQKRVNGQDDSYALPFFNTSASWNGKGKFKGLTTSLQLNLFTTQARSAQLTLSETVLDRDFISIGNPLLRSYWNGRVRARVSYRFADDRAMVYFSVSPRYSHRPFMPYLYECDGKMYIQPQQVKDRVMTNMELGASWSPVEWLELSPTVSYDMVSIHADGRDASLKRFGYGGSVIFTRGALSAEVDASASVRGIDGDKRTHDGAQFYAVVQYKVKRLTFGLKWRYYGKDNYTYARHGDFYYYNYANRLMQHKVFQISAIYSISKGKTRRHAARTLSNSSSDNGL